MRSSNLFLYEVACYDVKVLKIQVLIPQMLPGAGLFDIQNWVVGREKAGNPSPHTSPRTNIGGQISTS